MNDSLTEFTNEPMPKNWLVESIIVTVLCCLPMGVVGIVFASQVQTKFAAGDIEGAKTASRQAGLFTKIGFFIGLGVVVIYALILILIFLFGSASIFSQRGW